MNLLVVLGAGMVLAGCGSVPQELARSPAESEPAVEPEPTPEPTVQLEETLTWEPCDERFECAQLPVPLDHDNPDGPTIEVAVIRLPVPPAANRIGTVVVNPGGPGVSGVDFVWEAAVDAFPAEVRARFDIVGFDPRGVGSSAPITCDVRAETLLGNLAPADAREWAALAEAAKAFAAGCAERSGDLLGHVSTMDVVEDLELLRQALGEQQLTYLGFSYGTRIGAQYAERYPDRVRAMVLDGAVDPSLDPVAAARDQARALEETFAIFLSGCATDVGCPLAAYGEPSEVFESIHRDVGAGSLQVTGREHAVTPTELHLVTTGLLRDREHGWPWLAMVLAAAAEGDGEPLAALAELAQQLDESTAQDPLAALWAVNCTDAPVPAADVFPALVDEVVADAPRFGLATLVLELPCAVWPLPAKGSPAALVADGLPPMLVIGVTGDPVTPYVWSTSLAAQLDAVLVTREGARHTAFGGGNVCTDRTVSRYLIDLLLPPDGWSCG